MFHYAGLFAELEPEFLRIRNRPEVTIKDVIALVGLKGNAPNRFTKLSPPAQFGDEGAYGAQGEGHHLDRYRPTFSKLRRKLGVIHDNDLIRCGLSHHLFAKQRASAPFDNVELSIHLIGPINSKVNALNVVKSDQGKAQAFCFALNVLGARNAADVPKRAFLESLSYPVKRVNSCASVAEPNNHSAFHELYGLGGGILFEFVKINDLLRLCCHDVFIRRVQAGCYGIQCHVFAACPEVAGLRQ